MPEISWIPHGLYRFKGKEDDPLEVFEVGAVGLAPLTAPPSSEKAERSQEQLIPILGAHEHPRSDRSAPLQAVAVDRDEPELRSIIFLRLTIKNPNHEPAANCFAKVVRYGAVEGGSDRADRKPPSKGFKFPRSTHEGGGRSFPISGMGTANVDIAFFYAAGQRDVFYTPGSDPTQPNRQVTLEFPQLPGSYEVTIELGSESAAIPSSQVLVRIRFGGDEVLTVNCSSETAVQMVGTLRAGSSRAPLKAKCGL